MDQQALESTVQELIAPGKGILAADESTGTIEKRFKKIQVASTEDSRRDYRETLFSTPGLSEFISGVILYEETLRQKNSAGRPMPQWLRELNLIPGIKVDRGTVAMANFPNETLTRGLDDLRERLIEYKSLGAVFAKWRAVIHIGDGMPSRQCVFDNAHALARYAALCQEQGIVPIVEPEVLMDGGHGIERCEEVTGTVLHTVFHLLHRERVLLEGMVLKPNMVVPGLDCPRQTNPGEVAERTLRVLRRTVPAAVPGIFFLSGGQSETVATANLSAINQRVGGQAPWVLSSSFGRALQDPALKAWRGEKSRREAAQQALFKRAHLNSLAREGRYSPDLEQAPARQAAAGV